MSDQYFILAELKLPRGALGDWITTVAEVLDAAEGDVLAKVQGDRFSLRSLLMITSSFLY